MNNAAQPPAVQSSASSSSWRARWWPALKQRLLSLSLIIGIPVTLLGCFQDRLIYLPRTYTQAHLAALPSSVKPLTTVTGEGSQTAFYVPPRSTAQPTRVWLLFGGNAAQALAWTGFVAAHPRGDEGFLLIDYPGYGTCAGRPSPAAILASSEALVARLAQHLGISVAELEPRVAVLGHSLGCAAALQYASRHRPAGIVLIAPFTNMLAMARRVVGWPLCHLLTHRFDNRARLAELAATGLPPTTIIHGDADEVIPVAMGRALAAEFPTIDLRVIPGVDHNGVIDLADAAIRAAMTK